MSEEGTQPVVLLLMLFSEVASDYRNRPKVMSVSQEDSMYLSHDIDILDISIVGLQKVIKSGKMGDLVRETSASII